jgi:hypothetical protein
MALGYNNSVAPNQGYGNIVLGRNNNINTGEDSLNPIDSQGSVAMGYGNEAQGNGSIAMGRNSIAKGNGSIALGRGIITSGNGHVALGRYNAANDDYIFVVGNGQDGMRSNAFSLKENGEASFEGSITTPKITSSSGEINVIESNLIKTNKLEIMDLGAYGAIETSQIILRSTSTYVDTDTGEIKRSNKKFTLSVNDDGILSVEEMDESLPSESVVMINLDGGLVD